MSKSVVLTASGVVKAGSGEIFSVNVTKPGTGASSITIYDNPASGSGNVSWQGDGLAENSWDCSDTNGIGLTHATGIYVALAGTVAPTVVIIYS